MRERSLVRNRLDLELKRVVSFRFGSGYRQDHGLFRGGSGYKQGRGLFHGLP